MKKKMSLSVLVAVCLGCWDTIGLSALKPGLCKHSSKEKYFEAMLNCIWEHC